MHDAVDTGLETTGPVRKARARARTKPWPGRPARRSGSSRRPLATVGAFHPEEGAHWGV